MVQQYLEKYGLEVSLSMFSQYRRRRALPRRLPRHTKLLPWRIRSEHLRRFDAVMLRAEAKVRAGRTIPERERRKLERWKARLAEAGAVVHYDPDTEQGFFWVPRRPGIDLDLIREPEPHARRTPADEED